MNFVCLNINRNAKPEENGLSSTTVLLEAIKNKTHDCHQVYGPPHLPTPPTPNHFCAAALGKRKISHLEREAASESPASLFELQPVHRGASEARTSGV